ncbi:MAG: hypothetical protein JSV17_05455 [Candidatus Aminicenantes bacterium]|nr:MAG: hypothetical protein JSV17_05455 [Candidatus Aminicenantes bacterium]
MSYHIHTPRISVTRRGFSIITLCLIGLALFMTAFSCSEQVDLTIEELLEKSHEAYRRLSPFEVNFSTVVEFPGSDPGMRSLRYRLGNGNQIMIEIGTQMRVVTTENKLFIENKSVADRYLEVSYGGNLAKTLASVRGRSILAGIWEPPQAALQKSSSIDALAGALSYSNSMGDLEFVEMARLSDSFYELTFSAANGSCKARFDSFSHLLEEIEYLVRPADAPEDYAMLLKGSYTTTPLASTEGLFSFDPGERAMVKTLRELAAPAPGISQPPESVLSPQDLTVNQITMKELAKALQDKRVLLVGEDHLYNEPPLYLCKLLEEMEERSTSLLLELPNDIQQEIDTYMQEGSESALKAIFSGRQVLQLQSLLRWSFENRHQMREVLAVDEPLYEILLRRSYLEDTRNATMAGAIARTWRKHPNNRLVVYGGQLHMMKAGRYRVDSPSRETAGMRLTRLGIPENQIVSIMLNGDENFHLHSIWGQPGVLPLKDQNFRIPIPYLIDYPIFGGTYADEFFDYFVNLGKLTKVELE